MKLLIGGSPCTHWSIAQTKGRETVPAGIGWELFMNYVIAKEKYKPDFFLYENNKSMSPAIREQITRELGVEPILINSALVSAQNRERLYWTNIPGVEQPKDRGIVIQDILESGLSLREKAYALLSNSGGTTAEDMFKRRQRNGAAEVVVGDCKTIDAAIPEIVGKIGYIPEMFNAYNRAEIREKAPTLSTGSMVTSSCAVTKFEDAGVGTCDEWPVYTVKNGLISIKGNEYRTKLKDGIYIIRKLTMTECKRLQTVPEWYQFPVSPSQAYKMLGNGWTVDVIAHILSYCPGIKTDPVEVFSMYDGMSCGRLALDRLGANVTRYYSTEIDKFAIQTTQANFPDTIQLGDAFQVRENNWNLYRQETESEEKPMNIPDIVTRAHDNAVKHGFWDPPLDLGTAIALIHSELSEALEEARAGRPDIYYEETDGTIVADPALLLIGGDRKPEGVAVELADAVIRIADLCGHMGIDLGAVVEVKMAYNETRPYKHGKKF